MKRCIAIGGADRTSGDGNGGVLEICQGSVVGHLPEAIEELRALVAMMEDDAK